MKALVALTALLTMAVVMIGAAVGGSSAVTYIGHDKVAEALAKGGPLVKSPDISVSGAHRMKAGEPEVHEKTTHVWYVMDGSATVVTGGTLVGGKMTKPGLTKGTNIEGGQTQVLSKGDVIVIPAGSPHWWKAVPQSINVYGVNVVK